MTNSEPKKANHSDLRNQFSLSIRTSNLTSATKFVGIVLKELTNNETGLSYPSQSTLAKQASVSRQKANEAVKELEALGYIEVIRRTGKPNHYRLRNTEHHQNKDKFGRSYNTQNLTPNFSYPEPENLNDNVFDEFNIETDFQPTAVSEKPFFEGWSTDALHGYIADFGGSNEPEEVELVKQAVKLLRNEPWPDSVERESSIKTGSFDELNKIIQEDDDF